MFSSTINRNLFSLWGACKHLCVSNSRNESDGRSVDNPNNVRPRSFLFFFPLPLSFILRRSTYERSGGFTGQDISMFVFSNLQHFLLLTIFIHVSRYSIFKRSFLRVINSSRALEFTTFGRGQSFFFDQFSLNLKFFSIFPRSFEGFFFVRIISCINFKSFDSPWLERKFVKSILFFFCLLFYLQTRISLYSFIGWRYFEIRWMVGEYWKIKVEDKRKKKRARVEIITNDLSLFAPRNSSLDFRRRGNNSSVIRESNGVYQVSTRYLYFSITWLKRETFENQTFSIFSSKSF